MPLYCPLTDPPKRYEYLHAAFDAAAEASQQERAMLRWVDPGQFNAAEKSVLLSRGASFFAVRPADLAALYNINVSSMAGRQQAAASILSSMSVAEQKNMLKGECHTLPLLQLRVFKVVGVVRVGPLR